ncbi:uncharacterized protein G2W53_007885 [Senna tora]|uniref:Uncharacterized protein n=1 Tax=Senna tora TaxID=362788 RepID=A0A834X7H0_9FABA|nr:uncharacterized protein G2W53_007885 [Senna tora]
MTGLKSICRTGPRRRPRSPPPPSPSPSSSSSPILVPPSPLQPQDPPPVVEDHTNVHPSEAAEPSTTTQPTAAPSSKKRIAQPAEAPKRTRARVCKSKSVLHPYPEPIPSGLEFDEPEHQSRYLMIRSLAVAQCKYLDPHTLDSLHLKNDVFSFADAIDSLCDYPENFVAARAYGDLIGDHSVKYDLSRSKDRGFLNPALLYILRFLAYSFSGRKDNPESIDSQSTLGMPPLDTESLEAMSLLDCLEDGTFCFARQQQRQVPQPPSSSSTSMDLNLAALDAKLEALDSKLEDVRQEGQNLRRSVDGMQEFMERSFDEIRRLLQDSHRL